MSIITRFAPSPTGRLHVGNARTALFCALFARANGGKFMLRLDDTDTERSTEAFAQGIVDDLAWLGLPHDMMARQSDRFEAYHAAFEKLRATGLVYACYETPDELKLKRKRQRARGKPPVYDRAALDLTEAEKKALEAEGRTPHWRFKLSGGKVGWQDLVRGGQVVDTSSLSDPVLVRADGTYLYTLPSVVDDLDFKTSHVIRGEDHVTNSAAQIELIHALAGKEAPVPVFAHHPLLVMADGSPLSKRLGSLSLESLRESGIEPMSVNSLIARLGTPDPVEARADMDAVVAGFDLTRLGRAPARFDPEELQKLNAKLLQSLPFETVSARLAAMGLDFPDAGTGRLFWETVRGNLDRLSDATALWQMMTGPVNVSIDAEDREYLDQALACLPEAPWDETSWSSWTDELGRATGRKGRELFMPIRKALTGQTHGPEMQNMLLLIGPARVKNRLKGQASGQ